MVICDECNNKNESWAGYISTYNTEDKKYERNQAAYTAISGATAGFKFRVVEYEVFEVIS